jgi:hypothetical protein
LQNFGATHQRGHGLQCSKLTSVDQARRTFQFAYN